MIDWQNPGRAVILASGSPRRKQILSIMGFKFDTISPPFIEEKEYINEADLETSLARLAIIKSNSIAEKFPEALILGADTIVVTQNKILGKPSDKQDAFRMLRSLSGKRHTVMTGVALNCNAATFCSTNVSATDVFFRDITDGEIREYLKKTEYKDKAGAYAIQGRAMIFVDKIEGCFYNVVGLPVNGTISLFKEFIRRKESADV